MVIEQFELPEGWDWKQLGDICDISIGKTPRRNIDRYWGGENKWASIADLNDGILNETKECITNAGIAESNAKLVKSGTLMMSFKINNREVGNCRCGFIYK